MLREDIGTQQEADMKRPVGIDLFAGAGGMSLGFEQAGFDVAAAVEIDPIHCAVHKYNFPQTFILPRSVVGLSAKEIRDVAGLERTPIDCVFGGPPCQGFSLIGHRALDDPRNELVKEFVHIVADLEARTFVFENVKGLTVGKHRSFLEELIREFEGVGYDVRAPWRVFDAASYGVPQHRERLILLGAKKGSPLPLYPEPTTLPADSKAKLDALPLGPTCRDAIDDLPNADDYPELISTDKVQSAHFNNASAYANILRGDGEQALDFAYQRVWDKQTLSSSWRTGHTDISRRRFAETNPGETEPISRFFKLAEGGLSNTLRAGTDGARGAFTSPRPIHYRFDRCITVREMARLHGFPDWFRLHATKWHGARQIGNAVPPPLAHAVAAGVMRALGATPSKPSEAIDLGDETLLYLDTGGAAVHFDIERPNTRRDRKSGAKKRKQHEIEAQRIATSGIFRGQ